MFIRRSLSIFASKFDLVIKILIYMAIVIVLLSAIGVSILLPTYKNISSEIRDTGIIGNSRTAVEYLLQGDIESYQEASTEMQESYAEMVELFQTQLNDMNKIYIAIIILAICGKIAISLAYIPFSDVINKFMNSNISSDVANSMVQNFKKSGQYAMLDIFILTPVDIGLILLNNLLFKGLASLIGIFALPIGVIIGIIFLMARILMMSACIPAIVYDDVPVFKAFVESIKTAPYRFKLLFSKYFFVGLFSLSFLMLFGLSTLGIGYVLGFAMILMMFRVLDLVGYYNIKGYRYYLDTQRVVEPAILG